MQKGVGSLEEGSQEGLRDKSELMILFATARL